MRLQLKKLQSDDLLDLEDAVVAVNKDKGELQLHHSFGLTSADAITGSSALSVLLGEATVDPDKVLEELKGSGGTILETFLSHEDEAKIQAALNG